MQSEGKGADTAGYPIAAGARAVARLRIPILSEPECLKTRLKR